MQQPFVAQYLGLSRDQTKGTNEPLSLSLSLSLSLLFSRCGLYIRDGTDLALRMARSQPARQDEIRTKQDYITRQVARRQDVATSLIEANFATVTAAQEREEEWNTKGLESGLNPIVRPGGHSLARE